MPDWKIQVANTADSEEISQLYRTVWTPFLNDFPKELMDNRMPLAREIKASMEKKTYFIVRDKAKIIGVARATIEHGACLLDRMVVHPEFRGKGIGKALTLHIIDYARNNNAKKIWLDTSPKLTEAIALYESLGFRECGLFRKHYWGTDIKFYEMLI
ncbi:MAG: GNAT family N-acetyltransferase [Thermoplasmata archaeon]|nr:GNAT family N-acetyltransferase [Thermoplasmata archaeon]